MQGGGTFAKIEDLVTDCLYDIFLVAGAQSNYSRSTVIPHALFWLGLKKAYKCLFL